MGAPETMKADLWQFPPSEFLPWLKTQGIEEDICSLFQQHLIGGVSFSLLTEDDLREMGIRRIGDRKRLIFLIQNWRRSVCHSFSSVSKAAISSLSNELYERVYVTGRQRSYQYNKLDYVLVSECETNPKLWKVAISFFYCLFSLGVTAFAMVITHERLPDSSKYPPLPDIILDNLPYIPWAFEAAELVGVILLVIWIAVLICHRHRFILFRRYCSLIGTVFLLRSVTMCITSLSVPGHHLSTECYPYTFHSFRDRASRAFDIWFGMGMTLRGVRTCGDYMFSGHTTVITMLNFFITEYTPASTMYRLHTFTWILNIFGLFFILAAHEHYSIDVFIAAYITSRLFLYYHWLANNYNSKRSDIKKTMICFPLFSFFESDVQGPVPPQFSNPLVDLSSWINSHLNAWRKVAHEKIS